jgi:hypothetical protein
MIALSIARRTPASESALEIMLRSREGAQSKKFRLAAAIAFSYDYGHTSTNRATLCFAMRVRSRSKKKGPRGCSITGNLVIAITSPAKNVRYFLMASISSQALAFSA